MYPPYHRRFAEDFVLYYVIRFMSENASSRSPLKIVRKAVQMSCFHERYLELINVVLSYMKNSNDSSRVKDYRKLLLLPFHFLKNSLDDVFQLYWTFQNVVFAQSVIDDADFCHFFLWNALRLNPEQNTALANCLSLLNSRVSPSITPLFREDEVASRWASFITTFTAPPSASPRFSGEFLFEKAREDQIAFSKAFFTAKAVRITNSVACTRSQFSELNHWMRNYESFFFQTEQLGRILAPHRPASYHLSPVNLPLYCPRVISPSPYDFPSPTFGQNFDGVFFQRKYGPPISTIETVVTSGQLFTSPEWHFFHSETTPFKYSFTLSYPGFSLLKEFSSLFGNFARVVSVQFYFYVQPFPAVLFYSQTKICLLLLADLTPDGDLLLHKIPLSPVIFLPFTEAVALNEWHDSSLFCGHIVLHSIPMAWRLSNRISTSIAASPSALAFYSIHFSF
jgi:hypothetical protein